MFIANASVGYEMIVTGNIAIIQQPLNIDVEMTTLMKGMLLYVWQRTASVIVRIVPITKKINDPIHIVSIASNANNPIMVSHIFSTKSPLEI